VQLAKALAEAGHPFLVLERSPTKAEEARSHGFLTLAGEATHEETLKEAGIARARVRPRAARRCRKRVHHPLGAQPQPGGTDHRARRSAHHRKQAVPRRGRQVVLPTHIGAERITEMILYPAGAAMDEGSPMGEVNASCTISGWTWKWSPARPRAR
jgi:trk system potassium uptake protein TrkA/voltage-gated potassium channel